MIAITELLEQIVNGEMDPFKDKIIEAFKIRSKNKSALTFMELKVGMRVKLVNCQKILQGATGVIASLQRNRALVDLDKPAGNWHKGVSCPPGLLEVVK